MLTIYIGDNFSVNMADTAWLQAKYGETYAGGSFTPVNYTDAWVFHHSTFGATPAGVLIGLFLPTASASERWQMSDTGMSASRTASASHCGR